LRINDATESIYSKQDILLTIRCFNIGVKNNNNSELLFKLSREENNQMIECNRLKMKDNSINPVFSDPLKIPFNLGEM